MKMQCVVAMLPCMLPFQCSVMLLWGILKNFVWTSSAAPAAAASGGAVNTLSAKATAQSRNGQLHPDTASGADSDAGSDSAAKASKQRRRRHA
jgi:hypothetical protein